MKNQKDIAPIPNADELVFKFLILVHDKKLY